MALRWAYAGWELLKAQDWAGWCSSVAEAAWASFLSFWRVEVPTLLTLLAKSLGKAKIPKSIKQAKKFSMGDWLDAAPILAGISVCILTPIVLLLNDQARNREKWRSPAKVELSTNAKKDVTAKAAAKVAAKPTAKAKAKAKAKDEAEGLQQTVDTAGLCDSYWLTREALCSGMGLCYLCGFLVSAVQHRALWGSLGLAPVTRRQSGRPTPAFDLMEHMGWGYGDWQLELVSWMGVVFAFQMLIGRARSMLIPAVCWVLYLSIVNLQAPFTYSYGWEWLTCEVGFLVIFLCPLAARGFNSWTPPPRLILWLIRWCAFRLLLGAGMSKVGRNSSACWRQLTCTQTHYFTQPIPNPLAWYAHHLPDSIHKAEVALTFLEQLVLPFMMLVPLRACRMLAGVLEICFQAGIVGTGNYAWINFIGALPCLALLDDGVLAWVVPRRLVQEAASAERAIATPQQRSCCGAVRLCRGCYSSLRLLLHLALVAVMVYKSKDPIKELFGPAPWINSYDQWFLMNSQGVFGFINQHRVQLVLKYTHDVPSAKAIWRPLNFKCLPGDPGRRPCLMSPYHYRLDWETWIRVTASGEHFWTQRAPVQAYHDQLLPDFLKELLVKLLNGDDDAAGLMGTPIEELYDGGKPPTAISVDFASYTFTGWNGSIVPHLLSQKGSPSMSAAVNSARDAANKTSEGAWWMAEPVSRSPPWVYGKEGNQLPPNKVRKSPRERHWILGSCALGLGLLMESVVLGHWLRVLDGVVLSVPLLQILAQVLAADYEDLWQVVRPYLVLVDGVPGIWEPVPACLQLGIAAQQRCACEGARRCSVVFGSLALLWWSCVRRAVQPMLACCAFLSIAFFSLSVVSRQ